MHAYLNFRKGTICILLHLSLYLCYLTLPQRIIAHCTTVCLWEEVEIRRVRRGEKGAGERGRGMERNEEMGRRKEEGDKEGERREKRKRKEEGGKEEV